MTHEYSSDITNDKNCTVRIGWLSGYFTCSLLKTVYDPHILFLFPDMHLYLGLMTVIVFINVCNVFQDIGAMLD